MSWHVAEALALFGVLGIGSAVADRSIHNRGNRGNRGNHWANRANFSNGMPIPGPPGTRMNIRTGLPARPRRRIAGPLGEPVRTRIPRKPWPTGTGKVATARWAQRRDVSPLLVREPVAGRVVIGSFGRKLVAAEAGHSLLVVGPTQSGKTTGLAAPVIREWKGPVVAASVKGDLARLTMDARSGEGEVLLYDPLGTTGLPHASWSPLAACVTWAAARRVSADLAAVAREGVMNMTDGDFWYAMAAKLLAPLFFAAANNGHLMADVVTWVDEQELEYPIRLLSDGATGIAAGSTAAIQALRATLGRDERQRSAIFTTAETVIEAFADPDVAACESPDYAWPATTSTIDAARLLDGNNTLYLCAPAHDQRRLRALFATLVAQIIAEAYRRAMADGKGLDPPLLVVLDEAANVAPLAELDVLASTAAGHGVQLVTVWQDLAQLNARYGHKGASVVNNHRAKVFLSGIADPGTLEHASQLAGEEDRRVRSRTVDHYGSASTTDASTPRRLVPPDALRRLEPGTALLLYAHLPPARVTLRRNVSSRARVHRLTRHLRRQTGADPG
ncbi:MAG: type IV secretory system conjugative DNA transfer family protein [Acidimicrobiales bacterium]